MKAHESTRKKTHALAGLPARDAKQRAEINRKSPHTLQKHCLQKPGFEGQRPHPCTETIEGVVAAIIVLLEPCKQMLNGFEDFSLSEA